MFRSGGQTAAVLALMLNAATWGLSWWPFRWLHGHGVHPLWTTAFIYTGAVVVIGCVRPLAWQGLWRRRSLWWIVLASGLTNACFNWGVTIGSVTRVVLLFYLMPVWTVALAWWLLGERPGSGVWLRVGLSVAGASVLTLPDLGAAAAGDVQCWGLSDLLGLAGGMAFALNNVMLRREAQALESSRALAMSLGGALLSVTLVFVLSGASPGAALGLPEVHWVWMLPLAVLALMFLLSNLALQYGAARLPAQLTAVVMPSEVLFATASAIAWGGEFWNLSVAMGGGFILAAAWLAARSPQ